MKLIIQAFVCMFAALRMKKRRKKSQPRCLVTYGRRKSRRFLPISFCIGEINLILTGELSFLAVTTVLGKKWSEEIQEVPANKFLYRGDKLDLDR